MTAEWTRSRLRAPVPAGWFVKESFTLLAPDGQANVIVSREPLDPTLDTRRYAAVQGDLLRREFPGYEEQAFTVLPLRTGVAYLRLFSWVPPDGVRVVQHQIYLALSGTGFTATATTPATAHERYAGLFDEVLRDLELDSSAPPPPSAPGPAAPVVVCGAADTRPPPAAGGDPVPVVDRLVVTTVDLLDGAPHLLDPAAAEPIDAWDVAAVRRAAQGVVDTGPGLERLLAWGDAVATDGSASLLPGSGRAPDLARAAVEARSASAVWRERLDAGEVTPLDVLWAVGVLVTRLVPGFREHSDVDEHGIASALDRLSGALPTPITWGGGPPVGRHPRYRLTAMLDPGSGHLLWAADDRTRRRWDYPVDHFDLPIPVALARRVADLLVQYDAGHPDLGGPQLPSVQSAWDAFLPAYRAVMAELRGVLGPAYVVDDRIAPS